MANFIEKETNKTEIWTRLQELKITPEDISLEEVDSLKTRINDILNGGQLTSMGKEKVKNTLNDISEMVEITWLTEIGVKAVQTAINEIEKTGNELDAQTKLILDTLSIDLKKIEKNGYILKENIEKIEALENIVCGTLEMEDLSPKLLALLQSIKEQLELVRSDRGQHDSIFKNSELKLMGLLQDILKSILNEKGKYTEEEFNKLRDIGRALNVLKAKDNISTFDLNYIEALENNISTFDLNYIEALENNISDILDPMLSDQNAFTGKDIEFLDRLRAKILRKSDEERSKLRNKIVKEGFDFFYAIEEGEYKAGIEKLDKDREKIKRYLVAIYQHMINLKKNRGEQPAEEKYKRGILSFGRSITRTLMRKAIINEVKENIIEPYLNSAGNKKPARLNSLYLSAMASIERLFNEIYKKRKSILGFETDKEIQKEIIYLGEHTILKSEIIQIFSRIYDRMGFRFKIMQEDLESFDEYLNKLGNNSSELSLTDHDRKTLEEAVLATKKSKKYAESSDRVDTNEFYKGLL